MKEKNERNNLTPEEKIEILKLCGEKSLREIAEKHNLHHSTVDEIKKESEEVLKKYWEEKSRRIGRPREIKTKQEKQMEGLEKELKEKEKEMGKKEMRIDWLNLQLKWAREREKEYNIPKQKHLKKKKK
jgi:hypothetical protein